MNIAILSECAMANTHGTGAFLLRLFTGSEVSFVHFYLHPMHFGLSECRNSYPLFHLPRAGSTSRRLAHRFLRAIGQSFWKGTTLNRRVFSRLRRKERISVDVGYVVPGRETHARMLASVMQELQCPYVVHVMDILHDDGLDPDRMPGFRALFQKSFKNFALTPTIGEEIAKFGAGGTQVIPVGQKRNPYRATPPTNKKPLVIVMIGRPYREGTMLLERAWPRLLSRFGAVELAYIGAHSAMLPASMKSYVRDYGYVTDQQEFERLMATAHLAYLSGPSELDCFGRYSFPSRCSDYLMAGLPVVGCVATNSPTKQFLSPLIPESVVLAHSEDEIVRAVEQLTRTPQQWAHASEQAFNFARDHLSIETVRGKILSELSAAFESSNPRQSFPATTISAGVPSGYDGGVTNV